MIIEEKWINFTRDDFDKWILENKIFISSYYFLTNDELKSLEAAIGGTITPDQNAQVAFIKRNNKTFLIGLDENRAIQNLIISFNNTYKIKAKTFLNSEGIIVQNNSITASEIFEINRVIDARQCFLSYNSPYFSWLNVDEISYNNKNEIQNLESDDKYPDIKWYSIPKFNIQNQAIRVLGSTTLKDNLYSTWYRYEDKLDNSGKVVNPFSYINFTSNFQSRFNELQYGYPYIICSNFGCDFEKGWTQDDFLYIENNYNRLYISCKGIEKQIPLNWDDKVFIYFKHPATLDYNGASYGVGANKWSFLLKYYLYTWRGDISWKAREKDINILQLTGQYAYQFTDYGINVWNHSWEEYIVNTLSYDQWSVKPNGYSWLDDSRDFWAKWIVKTENFDHSMQYPYEMEYDDDWKLTWFLLDYGKATKWSETGSTAVNFICTAKYETIEKNITLLKDFWYDRDWEVSSGINGHLFLIDIVNAKTQIGGIRYGSHISRPSEYQISNYIKKDSEIKEEDFKDYTAKNEFVQAWGDEVVKYTGLVDYKNASMVTLTRLNVNSKFPKSYHEEGDLTQLVLGDLTPIYTNCIYNQPAIAVVIWSKTDKSQYAFEIPDSNVINN